MEDQDYHPPEQWKGLSSLIIATLKATVQCFSQAIFDYKSRGEKHLWHFICFSEADSLKSIFQIYIPL